MDFVEGKKRFDLFNQLKENKTLVKLVAKGNDYEQLTLITGTRKRLNKSYLLLDCPGNFKEKFTETDEWEFDFEFTGIDNMKYTFTTSGGDFLKNEHLMIPMPDRIVRHQLREHFRLEAPSGSKIDFKVNQESCTEKLLDVSLGGALVAMVYFESMPQEKMPFNIGDTLYDINLTFPVKGKKHHVRIKKAVAVRFTHNESGDETGCGLQFIDVDKNQLQALTEFIYSLQRHTLRNRLRVDL